MKLINLPLDGIADLLFKMANNYSNQTKKQTYKITASMEKPIIETSARIAALKEFQNPIKKFAFDTRRINQETDRNPRANLQYWHRSDEFVSNDDQDRINIFAKLLIPLNELKEQYGTEKEWHESYARQLYDGVNRILRTDLNDRDFFRPHLAYLEQLLDARYRLNMDQINQTSVEDLKAIVLSKDEELRKHGGKTKFGIIKTDISTQENIINAIFGSNNFRRDGEKKCKRTITITIEDHAD